MLAADGARGSMPPKLSASGAGPGAWAGCPERAEAAEGVAVGAGVELSAEARPEIVLACEWLSAVGDGAAEPAGLAGRPLLAQLQQRKVPLAARSPSRAIA